MPAQLRIAALNTVFNLTFVAQTPASFVDAVAHAWSRCPAGAAFDGASSGVVSSRRLNREPLMVAGPVDDTDESIRALSQDVTRHLIAAQTGRLLMSHAGAMNHPETGSAWWSSRLAGQARRC